MTQLFTPPTHSAASWLNAYRKHIRVLADWPRLELQDEDVGQLWIHGNTPDDGSWDGGEIVYVPWYEGGSWLSGNEPQRVRPGLGGGVLVAPALHIRDEKYILLDGCHRATEVKPLVLVLDYIDLARDRKRLRLFMDAIPHILKELK